MKSIKKIIRKDIFLDSHQILLSYLDKKEYIDDINLILTKKYLEKLSTKQLEKFYDRYIETGAIYALPEFYSTDLVTIPKGIADIREYRFFSSFGLILYNALGVFFAEMCSDILEQIRLKDRNIFSYAPTKYFRDEKTWKVNNKWYSEYKKFKNKIKEQVDVSDVILHIDISKFFNSINHAELVKVIDELTNAQNKSKYNFDESSKDILEYYLLSVMNDNKGLPQGRKNFASDYLAFLYMIKFDMNVENIALDKDLKFISSVRYVDDIYIFFKKENNLSKKEIHKKISNIEHRLSKWLYSNLHLNTNGAKTIRKIITNPKDKIDFLEDVSKKVSMPKEVKITDKELSEKVSEFQKAISSFAYPNENNFDKIFRSKEKREHLKHIYDKSVKEILLKPKHKKEVINILNNIDFELSATDFNILITLFNIGKNVNPFFPKLIKYFKKNFNPKDKRHIHILFFVLIKINGVTELKNIIKKYKKELLDDSYGKYLVTYLFKDDNDCTKHWIGKHRIYKRIHDDNKMLKVNFPFIQKKSNHPFINILLDKNITDSLITSISGYIYEFTFNKWSVAFNKLQMIVHELAKYKFKIKDSEKGGDIVKSLNNHISMSAYDERDFLQFWDRRNFNPTSHASRNGLTTPEVTKKELIFWEEKIIKIINKMLK